jgi:internalin A
MGWQVYEIPGLGVRGKINFDPIFDTLCDVIEESADNDFDEVWKDLREALQNNSLISENVTTEQVKQAILNHDSSVINASMLVQIRDDFNLIDEAIDETLNEMLEEFSCTFTSSNPSENYEWVSDDKEGDYFISSSYDSSYDNVTIQMNEEGKILSYVEAYNNYHESDYIPDATDIFEHGASPHRNLIKFLDESDLVEYMAYRFRTRKPEGSEDDMEYAEYRDVFGPMRVHEVHVKLGENTLIEVSREEWDYSSRGLDFFITRGRIQKDFKDKLEELPSKHTLNLIDKTLVEWLDFFKQHHKELGLNLNETELNYLDELLGIKKEVEQVVTQQIEKKTTKVVSKDDWLKGLILWAKESGIKKEKFPRKAEDFLNLTCLDLSNTKLSELPESIGNLTNLTKLVLEGNQLNTLPNSIGNLKNLTFLSLGKNQLSEFPNSIGNLTNLTFLGLSGNQLREFPDLIGNLTNLTYLGLGGNQLSELPDLIGNLTNLMQLKLSGNQLRTIPESFGNLPNLTKLNLQNNQLSTLPDSFGNLNPSIGIENVEFLDGNPVLERTDIPYIEWLKCQKLIAKKDGCKNENVSNIKSLKIYSSEKLPNSFGNFFSSLETLDLSHWNKAEQEELPESISNLTRLKVLNLQYLKLEKLPEFIGNLTKLKELNLEQSTLKELPESFGKLTKLTSLNLKNTQLKKLPESFGNLTKLTSLDLGYTKLTELPESFGNLTKLTSLNLMNTKLTELPESFGNLTKLTSLNLVNTNLTELPESLGNLTGLTDLCLSHNQQLKELPESFGNLTNLKRLTLSYVKHLQVSDLAKHICNFSQLENLSWSNK